MGQEADVRRRVLVCQTTVAQPTSIWSSVFCAANVYIFSVYLHFLLCIDCSALTVPHRTGAEHWKAERGTASQTQWKKSSYSKSQLFCSIQRARWTKRTSRISEQTRFLNHPSSLPCSVTCLIKISFHLPSGLCFHSFKFCCANLNHVFWNMYSLQ